MDSLTNKLGYHYNNLYSFRSAPISSRYSAFVIGILLFFSSVYLLRKNRASNSERHQWKILSSYAFKGIRSPAFAIKKLARIQNFYATASAFTKKFTSITKTAKSKFLITINANDHLLSLQGVAIIASTLKKKHNFKHFYVSQTHEETREILKKVDALPVDSSLTIIAPFYNDDAHKITIGIRKNADGIHAVVMDSSPIRPHEIIYYETITQNILASISHSHEAPLTIYYTNLRRQTTQNGCTIFALRDAVAFQQSPDFFQQIQSQPLNPSYLENLREIIFLPPRFMLGTQSLSGLTAYKKKPLAETPFSHTKRKSKPLTDRLKKYIFLGKNRYIDLRSVKYYRLFLRALSQKTNTELGEMIANVMIH